MDVIGLLQSKKRCLRRFLEVSEAFLAEAGKGDLSDLGSFESQRDKLIKTIALIDRRITLAVRELPSESRTPALSEAVQRCLDEQAWLVGSISKVDERIVACIELEKQRLQRELTVTRKGQDMAGRFKSTWVPEPGEELDQKA